MRGFHWALAVTFLLSLAGAAAAADKSQAVFRQFNVLEIENFENLKVPAKELMPESWIPAIREEVAQQVTGLHRFRRVLDSEDQKVTRAEAEKILILRGKIIEYTQGSKAARTIVGLGAGKGKISAMCVFVDKATGAVILERRVGGSVWSGGESTARSILSLAKEVAGVIEKYW